jgi:uncharacterized protein
MLNIQPLTLAQIPLLHEYLDKYPRQSCDYNISNLFTWGRIYNNQYTIWKDRLVIVNPKYSYIFYPIGPDLTAEELKNLIDVYKETNPEAELILIPEDWKERVPGLDTYFEMRNERDWEDYAYSIEKLVHLSGKKLAKKKNLVSQFVRAYPDYHVLPVTKDKHDVILRFTEKWKRERGAEGIFLHSEFIAIRNTLEMWDELPVEGILICHQNRISAYAIFSPQTVDMATIHFEKFDPDMKGSAQLINWETARHLQNRFKWINREQDMGLEGLRQAKLTYMPDHMTEFNIGKPRQDA